MQGNEAQKAVSKSEENTKGWLRVTFRSDISKDDRPLRGQIKINRKLWLSSRGLNKKEDKMRNLPPAFAHFSAGQQRDAMPRSGGISVCGKEDTEET